MTEQGPIHRAEYLETDLTQRDLAHSPLNVIRQTRDNLELAIFDDSDNRHVEEYVQAFTLPFLSNARSVIPYRYPKERSIGDSESEGVAGEFTPSPVSEEELAALNIVQVILSALPDYVKTDFLADGHSRSGITAPPQSASELNARIIEMQKVLTNLHNIENTNINTLYTNTSLFRTYAFFAYGPEIPLVIDNGETDKQKAYDYFMGNLKREEDQKRLQINRLRQEQAAIEAKFKARENEENLKSLLEGIEIDLP